MSSAKTNICRKTHSCATNRSHQTTNTTSYRSFPCATPEILPLNCALYTTCVTESTLRYWEKEFPFLRPKVGVNKVRQYSDKDIEQVKLIYNLIKVKGFKIAAARKYLSQNRTGAEKSSDVLDTLISVRDQLKELKKQLDGLV